MGRLDLLPENQLAVRVKTLLDNIEQLKTRQTLGGDSIKRYHIYTGAIWDVSSYAIPATVHTHIWRVTYTPDHPELFPFAELRPYWVWSPVGSNQSLTWTEDATSLPSNGTRVMLVYFFNLSGQATVLNIKFTFNSGDTGSLSFTKIQ